MFTISQMARRILKNGTGIAIHMAKAIQEYKHFAAVPISNLPGSDFHIKNKIIIPIITIISLRSFLNIEILSSTLF